MFYFQIQKVLAPYIYKTWLFQYFISVLSHSTLGCITRVGGSFKYSAWESRQPVIHLSRYIFYFHLILGNSAASFSITTKQLIFFLHSQQHFS